MIRALLVAALYAACATEAAGAEVRLLVHQRLSVPITGVTAAFVIDDSIADVSITEGAVHIAGRRAGSCKLLVVVPEGVITHDLVVVIDTPRITRTRAAGAAVASGVLETAFESDRRRVTTTLVSTTQTGGRVMQLTLANATGLGPSHGEARSSLPSISLTLRSGARQLTAGDQFARDGSATFGGRSVRGLHYGDRRWQVHAGAVSSLLYRSFVIAPGSEKLASIAYGLTRRDVVWSPGVCWCPAAATGHSALVPTLRVRRGSATGRSAAAVDIAYGNGLAAAATVSLSGRAHVFNLSGEHVPGQLFSASGGRPAGTSVNVELERTLSHELLFSANASGDRHVAATGGHQGGRVFADVKATLRAGWAVTLGGGGGIVATPDRTLRTISLPAAITWDTRAAGVSALLRYQYNSSAGSPGGAGGRLYFHATVRRVSAGIFLDYQRDAAIRLIPSLTAERLSSQAGPIATSQEWIQDDERASLVGGPVPGPTITIAPRHLQAGVDGTWRAGGPDGSSLRFNVAMNRVAAPQSYGGVRSMVIYSRALAADLDLTASFASSTMRTFAGRSDRWSYGLGLRAKFAKLADLSSVGRGAALAGSVVRQSPPSANTPMGGVRVILDGERATVTDANGRFQFRRIAAGQHKLEAILPADAGLRFATPAIVQAKAGDAPVFTLADRTARIGGYVRDDAGAPLPGVRVAITCGGREALGTSNSDGRYAIESAAGACFAAVALDSVPIGYEAIDAEPFAVALRRDQPSQHDFVLTAMRSITGRVSGAGSGVEVRLEESGAVRLTDATGRFAFRRLPKGNYTVSAIVDGATRSKTVDLNDGPAVAEAVLEGRP